MGKKKIKEQSGAEAAAGTPAVSSRGAAPAATAAKKSKKVEEGKVYVNASYNNTVVTVTDLTGNVLAWSSAGALGFAGPKKATPFASSKVIAAITEKLKATGPSRISIVVKGVGGGRDSAIRSLINQGFDVLSIKDATPIPHNGPRPRKVRRV